LSKIKLNLRSLSVPEKVARARQIVTALTGNADFASPQPALADVTASVNALETAYNEAQVARQEAKAKTSAQGQKEEEVDHILSQLASYIDSASGGETFDAPAEWAKWHTGEEQENASRMNPSSSSLNPRRSRRSLGASRFDVPRSNQAKPA
jgi:hypothetical protein